MAIPFTKFEKTGGERLPMTSLGGISGSLPSSLGPSSPGACSAVRCSRRSSMSTWGSTSMTPVIRAEDLGIRRLGGFLVVRLRNIGAFFQSDWVCFGVVFDVRTHVCSMLQKKTKKQKNDPSSASHISSSHTSTFGRPWSVARARA